MRDLHGDILGHRRAQIEGVPSGEERREKKRSHIRRKEGLVVRLIRCTLNTEYSIPDSHRKHQAGFFSEPGPSEMS